MKIITVSREFGSGGRELGKRLAGLLGFEYFDREIVTAISEQTKLNENYVESIIENHLPFNFPVSFGRTFSYYPITESSALKILSAQHKIIKEIASKENCVIVGRSANIILEEYTPFNIFVYAEMDSKIKRCRERAATEEHLTDNEMRKKIKQVDSYRAKNHAFVSDTKWGAKEGYHLCINTTGMEIKKIAEFTAQYSECWFKQHGIE